MLVHKTNGGNRKRDKFMALSVLRQLCDSE